MNRARVNLLLVSLVVSLSGCDGSYGAGTDSQIEDLTATWSTLEDGSKFALVNDYERYREIAMRCWPEKSGPYLCVSVIENSSAFSVTTISRSTENDLPLRLWGLSGNGYRCDDFMGRREEIVAVDDVLVSNQLSETGKAWSASFVRDYMAQNKIDEPGHFRCLDVLEAVTNGSVRTLGTTSITKAMVD